MNSESLMSLERKNQGVTELCDIKEERARVMSVAKKQCMQHPTKNIYRQRLDEYEQKFDRLERQQINYNSTVAIVTHYHYHHRYMNIIIIIDILIHH